MDQQALRDKIMALPEDLREGMAGVAVTVINLFVKEPIKFELPAVGEVWLTVSGRIGLVVDDVDSEDPTRVYAAHLQDYPFDGCEPPEEPYQVGQLTDAYGYWTSNFWVEKLADSPMEFYANREEILAGLVIRRPRTTAKAQTAPGFPQTSVVVPMPAVKPPKKD